MLRSWCGGALWICMVRYPFHSSFQLFLNSFLWRPIDKDDTTHWNNGRIKGWKGPYSWKFGFSLFGNLSYFPLLAKRNGTDPKLMLLPGPLYISILFFFGSIKTDYKYVSLWKHVLIFFFLPAQFDFPKRFKWTRRFQREWQLYEKQQT